MAHTSDTIIALATPSGTGAIAVIRLSGPEAISIANQVFWNKDLEKQASHTIHFGSIRSSEGILDEVLVSLFIAPHSYTKENVVEISTHGSKYIIEKIINLLISKGARAAKAGEFTLRAFLNGGIDLSQAEAVADLIASNSKAAHQLAMQQMRGGFSNELKKLREQLIYFASMIELELDFGEEDVEFANRDDLRGLITQLKKALTKLISSFEQGNVMKNGVPIVIAGKPNVGKSTLLNALLNEDRAIVSDIAGTTRDTIEDEISIHGLLFRFIDTAGIRQTNDVVEAKGVERTLDKMKQAKLILYLAEPAQDPEEIDLHLGEITVPEVPLMLVMNKSDLLSDLDKQKFSELNPLFISAKNTEGIEELKHELVQKVNLDQINTDDVLVSNIRHAEALQKTLQALMRVEEGIEGQLGSDFLAMDIKQALYYLGEITGEVTTDDLLETIFSKFCIGK